MLGGILHFHPMLHWSRGLLQSDLGKKALLREATAVKQASMRRLKYRSRVQTLTLNPKCLV